MAVEAESKTIGCISMNFAEGLEMLSLEPILDSSLLRGSRATFENAFYMRYLFIYYAVVSQMHFLLQLLLKKIKKQTTKLHLVFYRQRNGSKIYKSVPFWNLSD